MLEYLCDQNRRRKKSEKWSQKEIAKMLGWSESTLSRELKRGAVEQIDGKDYRRYIGYSAYVAQCSIKKGWENKGCGIKLENDAILARTLEKMLVGEKVEGLEKLRYSPEAIVMHFDRVGWPTDMRVCAKTIYNYASKGVFWGVGLEDLPRKGKKAKKKQRRLEKKQRGPDCKRINDRPKACEDREEKGHWEMDCIESGRGDTSCLLTLVERYTRECLIFKIRRQTQDAVLRKINGLERKLGSKAFKEKFKSITVDNGSEFLNWKKLEQSVYEKGKRTEIYYAHAYASWERGSNENLNGFIRYFIPKGTKIGAINSKAIKALERFINEYPRKILNGECAKFFHQAAA